MRARAVLFDFNGTLSNDEPVLCDIFVELFAEHGRPLSAEEYFERLCGLSDPEIVELWLGRDYPRREEVIAERTRRYRALVADGRTVEPFTRDALRYASERVPVGIVSGAAREEIEAVAAAAGVRELVSLVVAAEDVERGKPDPEGYLRALELLGGEVRAEDVLVFEDTEAGVAAAKAAGMTVVAVTSSLEPDRLRAADRCVERITVDELRRYLG